MSFYYSMLMIGMLFLILLIRFILLQRRSVPLQLFSEALRNENKGDFPAAIVSYETAMTEIMKARFPSGKMKQKITDKLKVLRSVIDYQRSFYY